MPKFLREARGGTVPDKTPQAVFQAPVPVVVLWAGLATTLPSPPGSRVLSCVCKGVQSFPTLYDGYDLLS